MPSFLFFTRVSKDAVGVVQDLITFAAQLGVSEIYAEKWVVDKLPNKVNEFDPKTVLDYAFCIGGDGTLLKLLSLLQSQSLPKIVTLSMGSKNYFGNFQITEAQQVIRSVVENPGSLKIDKISRLLCRVSQRQPFNAFNEISVTRGNAESMVRLEVYVNGVHLTTV